MKFAAAMLSMLSAPLSGGTLRAIVRLGGAFVAAVLLFSTGFLVVMTVVEGREFTWLTAIYWTLVTMTTLGFGDIVFETDAGRMYSVLVLLTGALLLLILLPFTFIQLVYLPWRAAVREARTPRELAEDTQGHILVTGRSPVETAVLRRAEIAGVPYALIVEDADEAASLHEEGLPVLVGDLDDPATYRAARVEQAAMVLTARSDEANTNVAFTVREVTDRPLVVATADSEDAVDVLELAGVDSVLHLGELLGSAFAQRFLEPTARSSTISTFGGLVIAEASAAGTPLAGRTLAELALRERFGVSVVALWDRGRLQLATADARVEESSVLVLAGGPDQLAAYDDAFVPAGDGAGDADTGPVLVLGGGRVGRAAARALRRAGTECVIVERLEERVAHLGGYVVGDAEDREVLERAGIARAPAVIVTTHDDDVNVYLTLYCRRLRPDVGILGRCRLDRNVTTMHRAGADFVLSYGSMGGAAVWNEFSSDSTLLLAAGLVVFRVPVPERLAGRTLRSEDLLEGTGCRVVGLCVDGGVAKDLDPDVPLPRDGDLVLVGDEASEQRFYRRYVSPQPPVPRLRRWLRVRRRRASERGT